MSADKFIANRMGSIGASGIRRIFDSAANMKDPIDLSMGQPDFDVPAKIKQAAITAIEQGKNGYTVTHGLPELRERIRADLRREFDWDPAVLVTCGVSGGLTLSLLACVNPGDEVLLGDPCFVSYPTLATLAGGAPVRVDRYGDLALHPERFADAITPRSKIVVLNSPGNPTGVVHSAEEVRAICQLADKHDLLILSDEIYNVLSFDGPPTSPVAYAPHRTILLRGFGKSYGMTGWRMGWAAGPAAIVQEMAKLQQYTFVCAPHPAQQACIQALDTDVSHFVDAYRRKRDIAVAALEGTFEFVRPGGGFYVFCKAPAKYENATAFAEAAIARNVLVIPGLAFSRRDTHFRISFAVDNDTLGKGCEILCSLA